MPFVSVPPMVDGSNGNAKSNTKIKNTLQERDMPALDWAHIIFLVYSGAHNTVNAWTHNNFVFFLFVVVGILLVELILWAVYHYWKEGLLIGKMQRVARYAGAIALFYAMAGILAHAQGASGNAWLATYYQWILPTSAPVMFFFAFWIQAVDPVKEAERETSALAYLQSVDEKREQLDIRAMNLKERKEKRKLRSMMMRKKLVALWKESSSRRTRSTLRKSSVNELPQILEEIGVSVKDANKVKYLIAKGSYDPPKQITEYSGDGSSSFT